MNRLNRALDRLDDKYYTPAYRTMFRTSLACSAIASVLVLVAFRTGS